MGVNRPAGAPLGLVPAGSAGRSLVEGYLLGSYRIPTQATGTPGGARSTSTVTVTVCPSGPNLSAFWQRMTMR